ncbi:phosphatase PAP2 family protein [Corynebacterium nuruki]
MTGTVPAAPSPAPADTPRTAHDLTRIRRWAIIAWAVLMVVELSVHGLAFDRTRLIILLCLGLIAACIGRHRTMSVILDWAPFAVILLLYDWTRNAAQTINFPVQWTLAPEVDKAIFGVVPTAWLQEHLKHPEAAWWEVIVGLVYMSYFIAPYAVAAWLWLKNRMVWRRFAACFIAVSFLGLIGYTFVPAAPPWAAARCTAEEVVDQPHEDACMVEPEATEPGGILGPIDPVDDGAEPYVERISSRGWDVLNIHVAASLIEIGQGKSNLVAAIPSLHAALTMLLAMFLWPRTDRRWRPLLLLYPFAMAFSLVFTAEHYVFDILLGWALSAVVVWAVNLIDRKVVQPRNARRAARVEPFPATGEVVNVTEG